MIPTQHRFLSVLVCFLHALDVHAIIEATHARQHLFGEQPTIPFCSFKRFSRLALRSLRKGEGESSNVHTSHACNKNIV